MPTPPITIRLRSEDLANINWIRRHIHIRRSDLIRQLIAQYAEGKIEAEGLPRITPPEDNQFP